VRFEYLILLIIAFNVVAALMRRRAKSKKAREAAERPRARRPQPSEHAEDFEREGEPAREAPRMPSLGRDILDQIARDLGLNLPKPASPEPGEREARRERHTPVIVAERRAAPARSVEDRQREKAYVIPASRGAEPATDPGRRIATGSSVPTRKVPSSTRVPRVNLHDPDRLREAFILKEILGSPVSRRRQ
jgi:hypothetical protein